MRSDAAGLSITDEIVLNGPQMEKRSRAAGAGDHLARCRMVLQRGLTINPDSAPLCQVPFAPA